VFKLSNTDDPEGAVIRWTPTGLMDLIALRGSDIRLVASLPRTAPRPFDKTPFFLEIARDNVPHQFVRTAVLLGCGVRQFRFEILREMQFHG